MEVPSRLIGAHADVTEQIDIVYFIAPNLQPPSTCCVAP